MHLKASSALSLGCSLMKVCAVQTSVLVKQTQPDKNQTLTVFLT